MARLILLLLATAFLLTVVNTSDENESTQSKDENGSFFNSLKNLIDSIFAKFKTTLNKTDRIFAAKLKQIARVLQGYSNDDLEQFTKDLSQAVGAYLDNFDAVDKDLDVTSDIVKALSLVKPNNIKSLINKTIVNELLKIPDVLAKTDLHLTKADIQLLKEVLHVLSKYPEDKEDLDDIVKKVLDYFIQEVYDKLDDEVKDKLSETLNDSLEHIKSQLSKDENDDDNFGVNDSDIDSNLSIDSYLGSDGTFDKKIVGKVHILHNKHAT